MDDQSFKIVGGKSQLTVEVCRNTELGMDSRLGTLKVTDRFASLLQVAIHIK